MVVNKPNKRLVKNKNSNSAHSVLSGKLTLGQKASDKLTLGMGSWWFILFFLVVLAVWMIINAYFLVRYMSGKPFDPYPFILLNLVLSCLSALQAPVILMSQNRQTQKDRVRFEYDYQVNRKAEREIQKLQKDMSFLRRKFGGKK